MQHLVTADEHSLLELEAFLASLPLCASGRVFIEVPDADAIFAIGAPARMTVTWLARSRRSGAPGTGQNCPRGAALARAACAWADEMLCGEEFENRSETRVTLLGGFLGTADIVEHLQDHCAIPSAHIDAPAHFGLLSPSER